ncbi:hypothetical protein Tco_1202606 [Tanacetum coccineum]
MIRSLMYLTSSRPDLLQVVCYCARYQARPTEKHLKEVKRIFRYLRGTINMGLWYLKDSGFELIAFPDVDHAGCLDTCKSTSGGIQFLGSTAGNPVKEILLKLNLLDHSLIPAESDSFPHAYAQATETYYKHQDSRIKKAQELKTKTSATLISNNLP